MSFKDRLLRIQLEEQERQRLEEAEKERRKVITEHSERPKILTLEEVEANEIERIVQIAENNIVTPLRDFGEVMWGAEMTDVDGVRSKEDYTWYSADKSSRGGTKTTYHGDYGVQTYLGCSRICRVQLEILSIPENKIIEIAKEASFYGGPESQTKGKRDVERNYGAVKWKHAFARIRTAAYWLSDQPLGRFDYCAVMSIGGVNRIDSSVVFGFDELSYLEKLEKGLEKMVKNPEKLSHYREKPPHSYEH